jgi:hypothetical protein
LSGCPSDTDSDVNKYPIWLAGDFCLLWIYRCLSVSYFNKWLTG